MAPAQAATLAAASFRHVKEHLPSCQGPECFHRGKNPGSQENQETKIQPFSSVPIHTTTKSPSSTAHSTSLHGLQACLTHMKLCPARRFEQTDPELDEGHADPEVDENPVASEHAASSKRTLAFATASRLPGISSSMESMT